MEKILTDTLVNSMDHLYHPLKQGGEERYFITCFKSDSNLCLILRTYYNIGANQNNCHYISLKYSLKRCDFQAVFTFTFFRSSILVITFIFIGTGKTLSAILNTEQIIAFV